MELALVIKFALPISLIMIMVSLGLKLEASDFSRVFQQPQAFTIGIFGQLVLVPLVALLVIYLTGLSGALAIGLLILSFSPGGTTSNLFSDLVRGDVALSVSLTAVASLITPFSLPLLTSQALQYFGDTVSSVDFPVVLTMMRLILVMLIPLILGMLSRRYFPRLAVRSQPKLSRLATAMFSVVILLIIVEHWINMPVFLSQVGTPISLMLLMAVVCGFALAKMAGLNYSRQKTIAIEVGMQNGGMALLVTEGVLLNPTMSIVPVMYGLMMLVPVLLLVWVDRRESAGAV